MATPPSSLPHLVIVPFMSKGHTIPLLYLVRLLRQKGSATATVFTTPENSPSVRSLLHDVDVNVIELPFPETIDGIPAGTQSTDKLPSMSLFVNFANATKTMQPHLEQALEALSPPPSCIVSDGFLGWTQQSAQKFGVPRLVFFGTNNFSSTMYQILGRERPHAGTDSLDEVFRVPDFPHLKLTRNDFDPPFGDQQEPRGPMVDFMIEQGIANSKSHGMVINSFYELEPSYADYWTEKIGPKAWCIGPLCLAAKPSEKQEQLQKPPWVKWLDAKLKEETPVLYVAFGTQAEITQDQLTEIAMGLERSQVSFLWVLRTKLGTDEFLKGFQTRVKNRGMVVDEWVDQMEILAHKSIKGFLSHCGWNSVLESMCADVPILAMPFMAEQHLNARLVAEEIGVGLRIMPENGSVRGFVRSDEVEKKVRELVFEGEEGKRVKEKMKQVSEAATNAMEDGGSSMRTLQLLIDDICRHRKQVLLPFPEDFKEIKYGQESIAVKD